MNTHANSLQKVLDFLNKLDEHGLADSLEHNREETLTVLVGIPGERWEIEFRADGEVEVEVFYSGAEEDDMEGEEALERLFTDDDEDYEEGDEEDDEEDEDEDDEDEDDFEDEDFEEDDEVDEEDDERSRP